MPKHIFKVLIVDDDKNHLTLVENVVKKIEREDLALLIDKADNYDKAIHISTLGYPDLLILDIVLPGGLSGLYIAAHVMAQAINKNFEAPKIIFISGDVDNSNKIIEKASMLGASFLWKPLDINVLRDVVLRKIDEKYPQNPVKEELTNLELSQIDASLFKELEHYVAHLIMEIQFFRTKSREMNLGPEEQEFLDEMYSIEEKTIYTFNKLKNDIFNTSKKLS